MREVKLLATGAVLIFLGIVCWQIRDTLPYVGYVLLGVGGVVILIAVIRFAMPIFEKWASIRVQMSQVQVQQETLNMHWDVIKYAQEIGAQIEMPGVKVIMPTTKQGRVTSIEEIDDTAPPELPRVAASLHPSEHLQLSPDFQPHADDVLSGRGTIFGVSGAGKSNTVATLCEELGRLEVPFILADTEDEYRSLCTPQWMPYGKLAGANNGYIVSADEAENFGRFLLERHLQIILNLNSYEDDEAAQVMIGVISGMRVWEEERTPDRRVSCMFILDEASVWLPQQARESRLSDDVLSGLQTTFFSDLVRRGRKRGMGLTLATQRIAEIDKRALQSSWKVLHRQTEDADLNRYTTMGLSREETLSLRDGEAFVFTSKVSKQRVQLRRRYSPHGANTPGLASIRNRQQNFDKNLETDEITASFGESFGQPTKPFQNVSSFNRPVVLANESSKKGIPETTKVAILARYRRGMKRTDIQNELNINGDEYWMVKQVCDEWDSKVRQEA